MTVARPAYGSVFTDPTASGGTALVLTQNTTASKTVALPSFTNIVIRAKGDQYQGAPQMKVSVNGKVVAKVAVAATAWTDYTVPFKGAPGTYTVSIAYTNDRYARGKGDRNLRLDTVTVVSSVVEPAPAPTPPSSTPTPGYFGGADWLWKPISSNPTLAANSSTWVGYLAAADKQRVANLYNYSVALVSASEITSSTPRYDVTLTKAWGSDPFGSTTVPIPLGTKIPPGTDGHVAVLDPTTGQAYGIWQAKYNSSTNAWSGSWGGMTSLNGNGIDTSGSATAAAIARYAGVVTAAEFSAAIAANTGINHALAFSTDLAGPDFVYPAIKSDGQNWAGVATPIPEGYRIQLNPDINVDAIAGMTPGERVIAKTLQTHGAYVVDQGGARMAFAFELLDDATPTSPGAVWKNAGLAWDYYDMKNIPWSQLRVLAPTATPV
ncbi:carbohydrate-binding domain-containing protein [Mycolicibacterium sp. PAM1]|uniref:carbohydrate-binding domain-containing protein n=1 Tax=Mycolicibacterium sp. PAM1 TaxID=2853535 RepID=UPI0020CD047E|nr:carbohydrate-binding domain-containing protein [Mycolicibacterium sp. PAM1]